MSRQQKDTVEYFPHDANASNGDTLTVLQSRFGNDGYAFWFKLLEKLGSTEGHYLDCRNSNRWQLLLAKIGVNEITGVEIMNLLIEMNALDKELWGQKVIWCQNFVNNLTGVYRNRRRKIPQKPIITDNKAISTDNNSISTDSNSPSSPHTPYYPKSKVKETKGKDIKENPQIIKGKYGEFNNVLLTDKEYQKLIERFGNQQTKDLIEKLSAYLASKGKRYKSHYATILNWQRRDKESGKAHHSRALPKAYTPTPNYPDL